MAIEDVAHRHQGLVTALVAMQVVDQFEIVEIGIDQRGRAVLALQALEAPVHLLEEGAAIECAGERIQIGKHDQLALLTQQPLGGAQPRIKFLADRGLSDELIGATVQRVDHGALLGVRRHQNNVEGTVAPREEPRLPAQFEP